VAGAYDIVAPPLELAQHMPRRAPDGRRFARRISALEVALHRQACGARMAGERAGDDTAERRRRPLERRDGCHEAGRV
jgi:hypothetical protein